MQGNLLDGCKRINLLQSTNTHVDFHVLQPPQFLTLPLYSRSNPHTLFDLNPSAIQVLHNLMKIKKLKSWDKVRAAPNRSVVWDKLRSSSFEYTASTNLDKCHCWEVSHFMEFNRRGK
ncbi:uncharacterized protein LOC111915761 [Lactuca sativa]|uniref:uncharacterized protein LOC111915761 n=1 Tax=Lactuca sativa TaxID=4236 RepID=UPI000CB5B4D0|nr:uncharacterized protein LOC111915761 [Lactuca sativa]